MVCAHRGHHLHLGIPAHTDISEYQRPWAPSGLCYSLVFHKQSGSFPSTVSSLGSLNVLLTLLKSLPRSEGCGGVLGCLPSICEALGSIFGIEKSATEEKSYFWQCLLVDLCMTSGGILQQIQLHFSLGKNTWSEVRICISSHLHL